MGSVLFTNVRIIDGTGAQPYAGEVLIQGNRIARIGRGARSLPTAGVTVIDGAGATLMPGMVEAHTHFSWNDAAGLSDLQRMPLEEHVLWSAYLLVDGDPLSNLADLERPREAARRHEGRRLLQGARDPVGAVALGPLGGLASVQILDWFWGLVLGGPAAAFVAWALADNAKLFLTTAMNGLTLAALYFLVASGFTLVFGLMRNVNLAHGSLYLLGAYVGYVAGEKTGSWLSPWPPGLRARRCSVSCSRSACFGSCTARTCARRWSRSGCPSCSPTCSCGSSAARSTSSIRRARSSAARRCRSCRCTRPTGWCCS